MDEGLMGPGQMDEDWMSETEEFYTPFESF